VGNQAPDLDSPSQFKQFFDAIQALNAADLIVAYHDRSDGGLAATLAEMAFAGHCGLDISISGLGDALSVLFNEELGAVLQVKTADLDAVKSTLSTFELDNIVFEIGQPTKEQTIRIRVDDALVLDASRVELHRYWAETSYQMQAMRDNPDCAQQEFDALLNEADSGLYAELSYDINENIAASLIVSGERPKVAILREQGVNGQMEMAASFDHAGFTAIDVHMSDILEGRVDLAHFRGLVACGGFSYGDVLGAGRGWASTILHNETARQQFADFFQREDTFSLGVCNGCQMLSQLKELIPGSDHWPRFSRNFSEQFEARFSLVEIVESPSVLLKGMAGSVMPIAVAHGEGRVDYTETGSASDALVAMRYVDHAGQPTEMYPFNPNGSVDGVTSLTTTDGRVTIMMPHPERVTRAVQHSWHPDNWEANGPWARLFQNARVWVG
jgi:phosphoribosylformylglycinamidine synthase